VGRGKEEEAHKITIEYIQYSRHFTTYSHPSKGEEMAAVKLEMPTNKPE
jgi:hypothetical protein